MKTLKLVAALCTALFLVGCASDGGTRIDNIPMYGQPEVERPELLKKADQFFIENASKGVGSREEASKVWYAEGEKYMREGNFDYAMRRYNQSWLLDPNNYQPYWGFGRVLLEWDKVDESIKYLEKAESLIDDPFEEVALLADTGSAYSYKGMKDPSYFAIANAKFAASVKLDPSYPESWRRWALSLYEQGDYRGAWEKVKKAQSLNAHPFPAEFLSALEAKLPRPKQAQ